MPALKSAGIFCYGDEENARRACTHEYLTTANQSEIRKAYLDSVVETLEGIALQFISMNWCIMTYKEEVDCNG